MASRPPLLDNRSFEDILSQLRDSARRHMPEWDPGNENDPGVMLQHTFARLMEIVIERLNRVPEKQMLAFLDAMNISPLPPVPARAPLIFTLKKDAPATTVPRGTAVTAKTSGGGASPVFETMEDLAVLPASITCAYTVEPERNRYGDYTDRLNGSGFTPFIGEKLMPDIYYFIENTVLPVEQPQSISLILKFSEDTQERDIQRFIANRRWSYSADEGVCDFTPDYAAINSSSFRIKLSADGTLPRLPAYAGRLGGGCEPEGGRYIMCARRDDAEAGIVPGQLSLSSAKIQVQGCERAPEYIISQDARINPDNYFLPFGDKPKEGDVFYIHMGDLFGSSGASVMLTMDLSVANVSFGKVGGNTRWCDLNWSYHTGYGWKPIKNVKKNSQLSTDTIALAFPCPDDAAPRKIGGVEGLWMRAVLPPGIYTADNNPIVNTVRSIRLSYSYTASCRVYRQTGHLYIQPGDSLPSVDKYPEWGKTGFYLGFDRFDSFWPASLYVDAEPVADDAGLLKDTLPAWECLTSDGWRTLYVNDDTAGFTRSGAVRFLTPSNSVSKKLFDNTARYWVRVSQDSGVRLKGIYLNAVPAEQATTVARESLGMSNGNAGQRLALRGTPVLTGQRVWVREAEAPTAAELPETTVDQRQNSVTLEQETWVLWQEQNSFSQSQPNSRHYTLDRSGGEICFGDGKRGMIPEDGSAIAVEYRFGGGVHGNLPAGSVAKLPSAMPGIEKVHNPIPAIGGADIENIPDLLGRGPMALRHRGRGVTAQDIEWLVKEAVGAAIDRIKCMAGAGGQPFALMLLPVSEDLRPLPDGELSARVRHFLDRHLSASLRGKDFGIVGPNYVTVDISAKIVPVNPLESSLVRDRATKRLHTFLHPRLGGTDGKGWEFGRSIYLSEICAVLDAVEGVEYALANSVKIIPAAAQRELTLRTNDFHLEAAYPAGSILSFRAADSAAADQWLLAEPVVTDVLPRRLRVTGLREGDVLTVSGIYTYNKSLKLFYGQPISSPAGHFPAGSAASFDGGFTTVLNTPLGSYGYFPADMLDELPPEGIGEGDIVTLLHPDTLIITKVRDTDDGGYEVTARRSSEDVQIFAGMVLECAQTKVRAAVRDEFADDIVYDGGLVTMRFGGFKEYSGSGGPLDVTLTLPDGNTSRVDFMVIQPQDTVTDTAYLFERELCTPGAVDIRIAE